MVIWFIGLSGAAKTTLSCRLAGHLAAQQLPCCRIDGDDIRMFFENDLGYTRADREANIKRIIYAAALLDSQGVHVLVSNISPFESLRSFARRKIRGYHQIYLKRSLPALVADDAKGVYRSTGMNRPVVGLDIPFEEPIRSELVLDMDCLPLENAFEQIQSYFDSQCPTVAHETSF